MYSEAAAAAPVRQTFAFCTVTTEPTAMVFGVAMPVHADAPRASTLTPTVSERPPELAVIVVMPPGRSALTRPCGSTLTSVGSPMAKVSVAPVTAFANASSSTYVIRAVSPTEKKRMNLGVVTSVTSGPAVAVTVAVAAAETPVAFATS